MGKRWKRRYLSLLLSILLVLQSGAVVEAAEIPAQAEQVAAQTEGEPVGGVNEGTTAHIAALANAIVENGFDDSTKWVKAGTVGNNADSAVFSASGANWLKYTNEITQNKIQVQLDVTTNAEPADANSFLVIFSADADYKDCVRVRVDFQNKKFLVSRPDVGAALGQGQERPAGNYKDTDFTWVNAQAIPLDILLDKDAKKVTFYQSGTEVADLAFTNDAIASMKYVAIVGQWAKQNFTVSNLKITAEESSGTSGSASGHIAAHSNVILEGFADAAKWNAINNAKIEGGKMLITAGGPDNRAGYIGRITAKKFLVQLDVTPEMDANPAADLKIAFINKEDYSGERMHVRLHFKEDYTTKKPMIFVSKSANNTGGAEVADGRGEAAFTWTKGQTIPLDILVDKEAKTITVYNNGQEVIVFQHDELATKDLGYFSINGQFSDQKFTISNLKITTNEKVTSGGDEPAPTPTAKPTPSPDEGRHTLTAYERVLAEDTFENGSKWTANNGAVSFADGKATIKGAGPINRMGYNVSRINANDMLIQLDMTANEENVNANAKIAFKIEDQYEGDRLQVRFNFVQGGVFLERTSNNASGSYTTEWSKEAPYDAFKTQGKTYGVDILVKGNNAKVYINGSTDPVLDVTHDDIKSMTKGYFAIAGQYPAQDFSIDNLKITTDEVQTGEKYTVTLKTATNGNPDDPSGGTVTAKTLTGYAGDVIEMAVSPNHNYVFDRFTSYITANGTSTDGLMPINNNRFELDSKFGNVTVVAHFKAREPGRFELFYDDFGAGTLDSAYVNPDSSMAVQKDGVLTVNNANGTSYLLLSRDIFQKLKAGEGYRISMDLARTTGGGTVQLMFRRTGDSLSDRHVLGLNGAIAFIKPFVGGTGITPNPKEENYALGSAMVHMVLEVKGNDITCYADGKEILKYTSPDDWKNQLPAVGLINMTKDAPVVIDNLLVERIPEVISLSAKKVLRSGNTESEDTGNVSGSITLSSYSAVEGDKITFNVAPKAGYRLAECYYSVEGAEGKTKITENTFTIAESTRGKISVVAVFEKMDPTAARDYHIDSVSGDDSNPGTEGKPWKSFDNLKKPDLVLTPGSRILLKRGSVFEGQSLTFQGMGAKGKPITVDAYGTGTALPKLAGNGKVENIIYLYNQEYIDIRNLEITNTDPAYDHSFGLNASNNTKKRLQGIRVDAKDFGVVNGIHIQDCYIHDINGNISLKLNGGICFFIMADRADGKLLGVPTKYDDLLIEGCTFINVDRSAVKVATSDWCSQWVANGSTVPVNWYPSTNVVVRNNYLEKIAGDGITVRDTDGALVEHNLAIDCRYQNTGYNVALWPFQAANSVLQYNEVYNTHSTQDGQGLDCDHASFGSLMQYNYSHNNEGGFMLIMGGYPHTTATVRYNVSQNDADKTFEFAQGIPKGVMIYNNTIYSKALVQKGIFFLSNLAGGAKEAKLGVSDFYVFNNLFCYPAGQTIFGGDATGAPEVQAKIKLYNNGYVGGIQPPAEEKKSVVEADTAKVLVGAGSAPESNKTGVARTGSSKELSGYQLAEGSAMIDKGVTMQEALNYFAGAEFTATDRRDMSPRAIYEEYNGKADKKSIDYVMAENFPKIPGVKYNLDFFGNSNLADGKPDIGAAEYQQSSSSVPTPTPDPSPEPSPEPTASPEPTQKPGEWKTDEDGGKYWYEDGVKQGTEGRGKEIYDPETNEWYWLDAENGGQIAVSKDVYQQDSVAGNWAEDEEGAGKWVRYDENGHMVKGWDTNENGTYYFDKTYGTMAKGYVTIEGDVYFFDKVNGIGTGKPCRQEDVNGWVTAENGQRFWYESGVAQGKTGRGKEVYDPETNAWYWLDSVDGGKKAVAKDVYQEFSAAGAWAEKADGTGKWVRYDRKGHMVTGWDTNENGTYYFDLIFGTMAKGTVTIDGKEYQFDVITGIRLDK